MDITQLRNAQSQAVTMIKQSIVKNRLSHAYIFEGDAGTMKMDAALYFAAHLLCAEEEPCMGCNTCARIINMTHPNVYVIGTGDERTIKKESIQALQMEFSKTTIEPGPKIYIIEGAERMNAHAQNALLKFLEEPLEAIHGILLSTDSTKLLPTIQSRSQVIPFHPLSDEAVEKALLQHGYEHTTATLASKLTATSTEAIAMLESVDLEQLSDIVKHVYSALANEESPLLAFDSVIGSVMSDKDSVQRLLEVFIHYQKDVIYGKINNRSQLVFAEDIDTIHALGERYDLFHLTNVLQRMLSVNARLGNYINVRLAFDNIMSMLQRGGTQ